jgi:hypothetical protein
MRAKNATHRFWFPDVGQLESSQRHFQERRQQSTARRSTYKMRADFFASRESLRNETHREQRTACTSYFAAPLYAQ